MEEIKLHVNKSNVFSYPEKTDYFNPSKKYPEYQFDNEISLVKNDIYDMIRTSLYELGLDSENYGTDMWNPFKDFICKNDTVLIKPNMVMHVNGIIENGTDCLITHPSLVRATIDYVAKALDGSGRVILADAPMQSCDFEKLVDEQGYIQIVEFYKKHNIHVELVDLRNYKSKYKDGILICNESHSSNESVIVNLGSESEFYGLDEERLKNLRITNYESSIMYKHHNKEKHEYLIAKQVLDADVIINMPKPKTHRKAGVTVSLKNLVGVNTNKEWLPHHTNGSTAENGDEYKNSSFLKRLRTKILEQKYLYSSLGQISKAKLFNYASVILNVTGKFTFKDRYSEGSWYGNDTVWRTIIDLNKIVFYADKKGILQKQKQRKMLIIGDMIISGEGEGPLKPTPKNVGIISIGNNPVFFDEVISTIMGFDYKRIPSINNCRLKRNSFDLIEENTNCLLKSNNVQWDNKSIDHIKQHTIKFRPSSGWLDYNR